MRSLCTAVALITLWIASAAFADDAAILLYYRFTPGQTLKSIESVKGSVPMLADITMPPGMAVGGGLPSRMNIQTTVDSTTVSMQRVESVDRAGTATITQWIDYMVLDAKALVEGETLTYRMEYSGGKLNVSGSGAAQMPAARLDAMRQLLARTYSVQMDVLGRTRVLDADMSQVWGQMLGVTMSGEEFYRLQQATWCLPTQPVKPGDTWQGVFTPGPGGGDVSGGATMQLTGFKLLEGRRVADILVRSYVTVTNKATDGASPFLGSLLDNMTARIDSLTLKMTTRRNFDIQMGRVTSAISNITLGMGQTIKLGLGDLLGGMGGGGGADDITVTTRVDNAPLQSQSTTEAQ